ncbi:MAG TPA: hypothetical protein VMV93_09695 [Chloroflexota bacterium]|nr:hypothetical protein [Chloroflexota bacterium]
MADDWAHNPRTPRQLPRQYGLPPRRRRRVRPRLLELTALAAAGLTAGAALARHLGWPH